MSARRREGGERRLLAALRRDRALWWATFVVVWALGSLWAAASPLGSAPDEPAHLLYAVAIAHGHPLGTEVRLGDPDAPAVMAALDIRRDYRVTVPEWAAATNALPNCYMFRPGQSADCMPTLTNSTRPTVSYTPVARYEPLYYALVGLPSLVFHGARGFHAIRVASAGLCAALVASAMVAAAGVVRRRGLVAIGLGLAVTPLAFFLFGAVNPSGFEIAAGIAAWATLLEVAARPDPLPTRSLVRAGVCCAVFVLVRPLGPLYLAVAAGVVVLTAARPGRLRELLRSRPARLTAAGVALAGVLAVGWILVMKPENGLIGQGVPGMSLTSSLRTSWHLLGQRTDQLVGVFGWLDATMPRWAYDAWLAMAAVLVATALVVGRGRQRAGVLVALAVAVVAPLLLEATRVSSIGFVWQGRYTLPIAAGVPVVAAWVVADRLRARPAVVVGGATAFAVVIGALQVVAHASALDRYVGGVPAPLFDYVTAPGWRPPLGRKGQLLASLALGAAWAAVLAWAGGLRHLGAADGPASGAHPAAGSWRRSARADDTG